MSKKANPDAPVEDSNLEEYYFADGVSVKAASLEEAEKKAGELRANQEEGDSDNG